MVKCLVYVLELNGDSKWKKYPIDAAGNVLIRPVQGNYNETPVYDIEAIHKTPGYTFPIPYLGPWRIWKQPYLIYPRLTKKFLKRGQSTLGTVDLAFIEKIGKGKILAAYDPNEGKLDVYTMATLLVSLALFFFLVVMPNFR